MQQKGTQSEPIRYETENRDDEIELIDIFRVIWKWKYLIVGGTAICAIAALIISFMLPKVYQVETLIQPGILSLKESGKNIYIGTPENIKALIDAGAFDLKVLGNLEKTYGDHTPNVLSVKTAVPKDSNSLRITYETSQIEMGIVLLDSLLNLLIEEYSNFVKYFKNQILKEIDVARAEIEKINSIKRSTETNVRNIEKRINDLQTGIISVHENTDYLKKERTSFYRNNKMKATSYRRYCIQTRYNRICSLPIITKMKLRI